VAHAIAAGHAVDSQIGRFFSECLSRFRHQIF
jgi:hypothetical protein